MQTQILTVDPNEFRREELAPAVECLRQGQVVALPTETVYGLGVLADPPSHRAALDQVKGQSSDKPLSIAVSNEAQARAIAVLDPPALDRLARRFWPGPLTLIAARRDGSGTVGLRVPAHRVIQCVLEELPQGLYLTSANAAGAPPALSADAVRAAFEGRIACVVDAGPAAIGEASALVSLEGRRLRVHRESVIDRTMILTAAATCVLVVCTGNTCRSPMAELLFREEWARAWGVPSEQLLEHGGLVRSAGTSAIPGIVASTEAVKAMQECGLDLRGHRSTPLTQQAVAAAHHIYGLSPSHVEDVRRRFPAHADRVELLDPEGRGISDPFGSDLATYRRCRDQIRAAIERRVKRLIPGL